MPRVQCFRDVVFKNTSPPHQRVYILKPIDHLPSLSDDYTEVTCAGLQEKYANRPKMLENRTFAEFAAHFQEHIHKKTTVKEDSLDFDLTDMTENTESGIKIPLESGAYLTKRKSQRLYDMFSLALKKGSRIGFFSRKANAVHFLEE